jgi:hypothetical protein
MSTLYVAVSKGSHEVLGRFYAKNDTHARTVAKAIFPKTYVKTEAKYRDDRAKKCPLCECRP